MRIKRKAFRKETGKMGGGERPGESQGRDGASVRHASGKTATCRKVREAQVQQEYHAVPRAWRRGPWAWLCPPFLPVTPASPVFLRLELHFCVPRTKA